MIVSPIDLSGLAALRPLLPQLLPPGLSREDAARTLAGLEHQLDVDDLKAIPTDHAGGRQRGTGGRQNDAGTSTRSR